MSPLGKAAAALDITCRPFAEADLPFVAELYVSTRSEEMALAQWPVATKLDFLLQQHRAQHAHYSLHHADAQWSIIERHGEAIGRLYLRDEPDRLHIIDISLIPQSRGQGIGEAILSDIADRARVEAKVVSIHVEKNNPARSLYQRLGFAVTEDRGVYDFMELAPS
jgi:ribosomal protein S18 acetylase RimI-like enzyme